MGNYFEITDVVSSERMASVMLRCWLGNLEGT